MDVEVPFRDWQQQMHDCAFVCGSRVMVRLKRGVPPRRCRITLVRDVREEATWECDKRYQIVIEGWAHLGPTNVNAERLFWPEANMTPAWAERFAVACGYPPNSGDHSAEVRCEPLVRHRHRRRHRTPRAPRHTRPSAQPSARLIYVGVVAASGTAGIGKGKLGKDPLFFAKPTSRPRSYDDRCVGGGGRARTPRARVATQQRAHDAPASLAADRAPPCRPSPPGRSKPGAKRPRLEAPSRTAPRPVTPGGDDEQPPPELKGGHAAEKPPESAERGG